MLPRTITIVAMMLGGVFAAPTPEPPVFFGTGPVPSPPALGGRRLESRATNVYFLENTGATSSVDNVIRYCPKKEG